MRGRMRARSRRWLRWTCIPSWCRACASISSRSCSSTSRRALEWIRHWVDLGSKAVEETLARDPRTGKFCVGDQVTVADLCLAAHLTSAKLLARPRSVRLSERGPHLCDLHGDGGFLLRASAAPAGRACGALDARCARSRRLLSGSLCRRRSALRDRADLQADGRRVRLGARRARARGRRSTCWCRRSRLSSRAVWPIA